MLRQDSNAQIYDTQSEMMEENRYSPKRNPYLVDYAQQRRRMERDKVRHININLAQQRPGQNSAGRRVGNGDSRRYASAGQPDTSGRAAHGAEPSRGAVQREGRYSAQSGEAMPNRRPAPTGERESRRPAPTGERASRNPAPAGRAATSRRSAQANRAARQRRKKRIFMQRLTIGLWVMCIILLGTFFAVRNRQVSAAANNQNENIMNDADQEQDDLAGDTTEVYVQGIPQETYAKHPEWIEDFLTPNEYSRPGDPLNPDDVTNIFVHYTANPGTSAAQNRSYFEQQKDVHQSSVSAHFIIGYEGEIIQCVPLDEIAYAVQTRNYDSISIECCHLATDGSFTQETYDSLIELLAWLIDAYGLNAEDILRHYDCGGKKCPLYYVNNPEAWVQLKKDVDNYR